MRVHDDSKASKCDVCLKVFPTKSQLKMHYRTHTGEKPFACQICDRKYSRKGNLNKHMIIHDNSKCFLRYELHEKTFKQTSHLKHFESS